MTVETLMEVMCGIFICYMVITWFILGSIRDVLYSMKRQEHDYWETWKKNKEQEKQ